MDFSSALVAMRMGIPMRRLSYAEGLRVVLVHGTPSLQEHFAIQPPAGSGWVWTPSTTDLLATDWVASKPPTQGVLAEGFEAFKPMGSSA